MSNATGRGISLTSLLGLLFIALKLTNAIDWSWWWVTCPFWGPVAIFAVLSIGFGILTAVFTD